MTPQQRRELVERPFPVVRYLPPQKRWAGVQVQDMDSFHRKAYETTKYEGAEEAALKSATDGLFEAGAVPVMVSRERRSGDRLAVQKGGW